MRHRARQLLGREAPLGVLVSFSPVVAVLETLLVSGAYNLGGGGAG